MKAGDDIRKAGGGKVMISCDTKPRGNGKKGGGGGLGHDDIGADFKIEIIPALPPKA